MTTTTDAAAAIRAALKAKHITSRQVSVRAEYYSMGSSIHVTIKDAAIRSSIVRAIAAEHEDVRRCEMTGEILNGGNRYLHVRYTSEVLAQLAARYIAQVEAAAAQIQDNALIPVEGTPFLLGTSQYGGLSIWKSGEGHLQACYDAQNAAIEVGVRMLDHVN